MGHLVANSLIIIEVVGLFENNGPIKFMWKLRHVGYNHQVMHNMVNEHLLKFRDMFWGAPNCPQPLSIP